MPFTGGFHRGRTMLGLAGLFIFTTTMTTALAVGPVVSNVRASQRAGTQLVDVDYDVADADSSALTRSRAVATKGGAGCFAPGPSGSGGGGAGVAPGTNKRVAWNEGVDLPAKL